MFGPAESDEARWLIARAVAEDLPAGDITTSALFPAAAGGRSGVVVTVDVVPREVGVLCGGPVVETLFREHAPSVEARPLLRDGDRLVAGRSCFRARGPVEDLLRLERIALNFLQRLSGIASEVARWVDALAGSGVQVLDTRKTTPAWRALEKYAVRSGGGVNHRASLSDAILVKDNHRETLRALGADRMDAWVGALRARCPGVFLEVEVDTRDEYLCVLDLDVDAVLLDNFGVADLRWAVEERRRRGRRRPLLEASGGVRLEKALEIARTGIDRISAGCLTHSARALDLGLDFTFADPPRRSEGGVEGGDHR